jgi:hypothetical protein
MFNFSYLPRTLQEENETRYDEQVFGDNVCRSYRVEGTFMTPTTSSVAEYCYDYVKLTVLSQKRIRN